MITPREAARRIAEREANRLRQKQALRRQDKAVSAAFAAGHTIQIGRRAEVMSSNFDPAKSTPADAHKLLVQVAKLLGVDDPEHADHQTIDAALDAVFAAVTGASANPSDPKKIDQNAVRRGRQLMPSDMTSLKRAFHRTSVA